MKRSHWLTALVTLLIAAMTAPLAAAEPPDRVDLCHQTGNGTPSWNLITVSARSVDKHLEHGDGEPLGEVPGSDGQLVFDESCEIVDGDGGDDNGDPGDDNGDPGDGETVFAIAYTDVDGNGEYDDTDVLIAKFVDGPSPADDGLPGAGDLIITDRYPTDLGVSSFADFGVNEHLVSGVNTTSGCLVSTAGGPFIWDASSTVESYQEGVGNDLTFVIDSSTGAGDGIVTKVNSPSSPTTPVVVSAANEVDDPFLEVKLAC